MPLIPMFLKLKDFFLLLTNFIFLCSDDKFSTFQTIATYSSTEESWLIAIKRIPEIIIGYKEFVMLLLKSMKFALHCYVSVTS